MDWKNHLEKKQSKKLKKNSKIEIAACDQKTTRKKANYIFKHRFLTVLKNSIEQISRRKTSLFRSTSCFGVTKFTLQFDFKNHVKMCEEIFKKNESSPIQFKIFEL